MKPTTHRPRNYLYTIAAKLAGLDRSKLRAAAVKVRYHSITHPVPEGTVAVLHEQQPHAYGLNLAHLRRTGRLPGVALSSSRPRVVRTHQRQRRQAPKLRHRIAISDLRVHDSFAYLER